MTKAKPLGVTQGSSYTGAITKNGRNWSVSIPAYGGGNTGGGGGTPTPGVSMTISMRRASAMRVAPEGIAFFANVSGFDAQPPANLPGTMPAAGDVYDETMHDIAYVWDFGDTGTWSAYERMLPQWNDRSVGYGPFPSHVFANPGTYTVLCGAYERSSGKQAFASIDVTVADPNVFYQDAYTICIAPDGNFTGAPTTVSANRVATIEDADMRVRAIRGDGQPCRILLKSGQVHPITRETHWGSTGGHFIGTWGGSAPAIVEPTQALIDGSGFVLYGEASGVNSGCTVANIDYRDGWNAEDPITSTKYVPSTAFRCYTGHCTVYDCTASGVSMGYGTGFYSGCTSIFGSCSVTGWKITGFWGEGFQNAGNPSAIIDSYVGLAGCRATQDVNATINGVDSNGVPAIVQNGLGPMRCGTIGYLHIDGFETYSRTGWSLRSDNTWAEQSIRDGRNDPRSKGFISRLYGEGGWGVYATDNGAHTVHYPCNTVLDKFYFLSSANSNGTMHIRSSCTTVRNGILHEPNVKNDAGANPYFHGISIGYLAHMQAPENRLYPVKIYNVSIVNEQTPANNSSAFTPIIVEATYWNEGQVETANNVVHRPNYPGGFTGDAPLDTTRLGIDARNLGWKWYGINGIPAKIPMDTSYATPANPLSLWRPTTGSPAIASATGDLVAYDDFLGRVRPVAASRGATEPGGEDPAEGELPEFSVETIDGTSQVTGNGDVSWTLTAPAEYAGTHLVDRSEEHGGNLNIQYAENTAPQCIVAPLITRRSGPGGAGNHYPGTTYGFVPPLWQIKTGVLWTTGHEWYEGAVASGITDPTYSRVSDAPVEVRHWIEVQGQPRRHVRSAAVVGEIKVTRDDFTAADGTDLKAYTGPSGFGWSGQRYREGVKIQNGYVRGNYGAVSNYYMMRADLLGNDHWSEAEFKMPATIATSAAFTAELRDNGPAVRCNPTFAAGETDTQCYLAAFRLASGNITLEIRRADVATGAGVRIAESAPIPLSEFTPSSIVKMRLTAKGSTITASLTGLANPFTPLVVTDGTYSTGKHGLSFYVAGAANSLADYGLTAYDAGVA